MSSLSVESLLLESIIRSLVMAAVVWTGIKLLRIKHVLAQKIAWGMVLLAAFTMPVVMRWQSAHPGTTLVVPLKRMPVVASIEKHVSSLRIEPAAASNVPTVSSAPTSTGLSVVSMQPAVQAPARIWGTADLFQSIIQAYFVICGILLLRLFFGLALAVRIWNRAERASPILEPRANVRISSSIQSPVTIGSGIVLPANYTEWDRSKLRLVLAHERSHVHQGDFYLQLLASFYAALVWFSPLGWWLKRRLADLGEALSDRAALLEAEDNSSYAEVLLEFAAMPRRTFAGVTAGVGMARSSNIQHRIERILNDRIFRQAFASGRRHATIAVVLVPFGLILATSLLHVKAAETAKARAIAVLQTDLQQEPKIVSIAEPAPIAPVRPRLEPAMLSAIAQAPVEPRVSLAEIAAEDDPQDVSISLQTGEDGSFAIVDGNGTSGIQDDHGFFAGSWDDHGELDHVRSKVHGSFLWFERDGKSYVITDPDVIAKSKALYAPQGELGHRQAELGKKQAELGKQEGLLAQQQAWVKVPTPDISKEMAELQKTVNALAAEKVQEITQERLGELQAELGAMQGRLAEAQALAGSKQAILGTQQSDFGAKQAELGRQQAELGREQGRIAREATQKIRSMIDQAFRDGKAKPVD